MELVQYSRNFVAPVEVQTEIFDFIPLNKRFNKKETSHKYNIGESLSICPLFSRQSNKQAFHLNPLLGFVE